MRKFKLWVGRLLAVAVAAFASAVALPVAAHAGTCTDFWWIEACGELYNGASTGVAVSDTWCGDNTPRYGDSIPGCTNTYIVSQYDWSSEQIQDADAFRSTAGCVTKFNVETLGADGSAWQISDSYVDDRRGKSTSKWMKFSDDTKIYVTSKTCGSMMASHYVQTWADAQGFQDQWCGYLGTNPTTGGGPRCAPNGWLWAANNYFYCKVSGGTVSGSGGTWNSWWLLTDLDSWTGDGRAFVSAYYLSGGPNDTQNNRAAYWNGSAWVDFPNC